MKVVKRFLLASFVLVCAAPVFANDDGGDGATIPDYQTLVREGYGPRTDIRVEIDGNPALRPIPKPTQAYYGNGYTIYYSYTAVQPRNWDSRALYAFGYPADYFRKLMPKTVTDTNLDRYAVELSGQYPNYEPGEFQARARASHANAVTTVQTVKTNAAPANGTSSLPAIGEKPAH